MKNKLIRTGLALGLFASIAASTAFAQQQTPEAQTRMERRGGRHGRVHGHGKGAMRFLSRLNLTDAQKQQISALRERFAQSTRAQRDELRQLFEQRRQGTLSAEQEARARALHTELGEASKLMHNEVLAVLTPEQRAQLEQLKQEHKSRRERRRGGLGDEQ
ncbi:MAG: Spy/CpxP family protein refolding chaperone [Acidobacteria bacterium]|nr:Spy/CpxP family protein refolding chaperone [Acidobacteriota bacterium]